MKKVTLITPYPPTIGGGAVVLKSIIPFLHTLSVKWLYFHTHNLQLADYVYVGKPVVGGSILNELRNSLLWFNYHTQYFNTCIDFISHQQTDIFWIVGHNEGILIANALAGKTQRPIHLTIHDDTPYGMLGRSRRYKMLASVAQKRLKEAFQKVASVDVIGKGMQQHYKHTMHVDSFIVHRYISELPELSFAQKNAHQLIIGHIGSVYTMSVLYQFCLGLRLLSQKTGLQIQLYLIGMAKEALTYFNPFSDMIKDHGQLQEEKAIGVLSECDFVYAMYPFSNDSTIFRKTSLPTKMSTYIQSQRPIFAHTPGDSSMAYILKRYKMGLVCTSLDESEIMKEIEKMINFKFDKGIFEQVREELFGFTNVKLLEDAFSKLSTQRF